MKTIYKYNITSDDEQRIEMPAIAQVLTVQCQNGHPRIWVAVDPDSPTLVRRFRLVGTGHAFDTPDGVIRYVGTFQLYGGDLVFHLFDLGYERYEDVR